MEKIFFLLIIVVIFYALRLVLSASYGRNWWWAAIVGHGLIITFFLQLFSNSPSLIMSDQIDLIGRSGASNKDKAARVQQFVRNNMICIDIANDQQIIETVDSMYSLPVMESISDRAKLNQLLSNLYSDEKYIDLIVLDLGFSGKTENDCQLRDRIFDLHRKGKILLAGPPPHVIDSCNKLPDAVYAAASAEMSEGNVVTSHTISENKQLSLAYIIYQRLEKSTGYPVFMEWFISERDSSKKWSLALNTFLPSPLITDNSIIKADSGITTNSGLVYHQLRETLTPVSAAFLHQEFVARKQQYPSKKNVVFIGRFIGSDDIHITPAGPQHGSSILINLVYALTEHKHTLHAGLFFSMCIIITLVTFLMVYIQLYIQHPMKTTGLIFLAIKRPLDATIRWAGRLKEQHVNGRLINFILTIADILISEIHLIILLILTLIIYQNNGNLINAFLLFLYFSIVNKLLSYYFKHQ